MALRSLKPVTLRCPAAGTEGSFVLPANTARIDLFNKSGEQVRWSLTSGLTIATPGNQLTLPYQFNILNPNSLESKTVKIASGTVYYSSNLQGAEFTITPFVKG